MNKEVDNSAFNNQIKNNCALDNQNIDMDNLIDIRQIHMEENMTREQRIQHLKDVSHNGYVKYDNVLIHLDFKSVYDCNS